MPLSTLAVQLIGSSTRLTLQKTCTRSSYLPRQEFPESSLKASQSLALFEIHFHSDEGNEKCKTKLTSQMIQSLFLREAEQVSTFSHSQ